MSFNGSGAFVINTAGQPVVSGTTISSTVFNALTADLASGLSTCVTKDGQTTATAKIPFALGISLGTSGSVLGTMDFSGSTSGTTVLQASAVASGTLTLPAATDTLVGKATTDTLTNKTLTGAKATSTFGVGNATPAASGSGITFPATADPSTDANTLDDYEEGTFTPSFTFATPGDLSVTYTSQVGFYTKIGNMVSVIVFVNMAAGFTFTTAAGSARINGFPFTSVSSTNSQGNGAAIFAGVTKAGYTAISMTLTANSTQATLSASGSGVAVSGVSATDMPSGGSPQFRSSFIYYV